MTYQQLTASEHPLGTLLLRRTLLEHKRQALQQGVLLPDDFIADLEAFAERNIIHIPAQKGKEPKKELCQHCLKGFMMTAAEKHQLQDEAKDILAELFKKESLGHNGYYLDSDEVMPVQAV